ncbi:hypothetical protein LCGC14_1605160 [marine sediment metagenome]|uniref:Uncharacterized protein n=1 Tax=marine sediment metagenome TaxID=412755 RepID=A0A0F9KQP1_9ZZZZ
MTSTIPENEYQDCIEEMNANLAAERKFRDELEAWLEAENKKHHDEYLKELNPSATASSVAYERCLFMCRKLKAQHLGDSKGE